MCEPLNHIHQDAKSAWLIAVCKRSLTQVYFLKNGHARLRMQCQWKIQPEPFLVVNKQQRAVGEDDVNDCGQRTAFWVGCVEAGSSASSSSADR